MTHHAVGVPRGSGLLCPKQRQCRLSRKGNQADLRGARISINLGKNNVVEFHHHPLNVWNLVASYFELGSNVTRGLSVTKFVGTLKRLLLLLAGLGYSIGEEVVVVSEWTWVSFLHGPDRFPQATCCRFTPRTQTVRARREDQVGEESGGQDGQTASWVVTTKPHALPTGDLICLCVQMNVPIPVCQLSRMFPNSNLIWLIYVLKW